MKKSLKELIPGKKGKITNITGSSPFRRRLLDMGFMPGVLVEMERYAPLGDPIEVKIQHNHLSLRIDEAAMIEIEEE